MNGGRYNPAEEFGAVYLSESPEGCKAEVTRRPQAPVSKYIVGTVRVHLGRVCDLTDDDLLGELGLDKIQITSNDTDTTEILGRIIRDAGFEAIIAPSAAGDYENLIVFEDRLSSTSRLELEDEKPM